MHITSIRPRWHGTGREVARFDLQLTDDVRLCDLRLVCGESGAYRIHSPSTGGQRFATFAPAVNAEIAALAVAGMGGQNSASSCHR